MCMDWGVRVSLPTWLEVCGERYRLHVAALRALPEVADWEDLANAMPVLVSAQKEADAAWAAARAAARDAAWAAAWDAAWDAAWAAARAAARAAAWAAARAAAWDRLRPVITTLQDSAADLVLRMCAIKEPRADLVVSAQDDDHSRP
jgi:hypothetical protein